MYIYLVHGQRGTRGLGGGGVVPSHLCVGWEAGVATGFVGVGNELQLNYYYVSSRRGGTRRQMILPVDLYIQWEDAIY